MPYTAIEIIDIPTPLSIPLIFPAKLYAIGIIEEVPIDNYGISTDSNYVVGMNTMLNKTLVDEGLTRDVIRKVQNLRKESEFEVEDRIEININANDSICLALESNKKYFLSEVLVL